MLAGARRCRWGGTVPFVARSRRPRYPRHEGPLPEPLPPEFRTIGQLVAETLRLYGENVWKAFAIGVLPSVVNVITAELGNWRALVFSSLVGSLVFSLSFLVAAGMVGGVSVSGAPARTAYAAGVLVFLPFPFLTALYILPGLAWVSLVGLAVPAALIERRGLRGSLRRAVQLARADFVHALGGLATLAIVVVVTQFAVVLLLGSYADLTGRVAGAVAGVVLSPVLFIGASLLYFDQDARVGSGSGSRDGRKTDAELSAAHEPHR
jgi:hypothetical protein